MGNPKHVPARGKARDRSHDRTPGRNWTDIAGQVAARGKGKQGAVQSHGAQAAWRRAAAVTGRRGKGGPAKG